MKDLKTRCKMDATNFPFDTQNCSIKIGSWQYDKSIISLTSSLYIDPKSDYTSNPIWDLIMFTNHSLETSFRSHNENDTIEDIWFNMTIKRRPSYYMINNIYPCLILNIVSLLAFALPFASQITLSK